MVEFTREDLEELSYNQLRAVAKQLRMDATGTKAVLVEGLWCLARMSNMMGTRVLAAVQGVAGVNQGAMRRAFGAKEFDEMRNLAEIAGLSGGLRGAFGAMNREALREMAQIAGVPTGGKKAVLVDRLMVATGEDE
jgi:hypothetical protein